MAGSCRLLGVCALAFIVSLLHAAPALAWATNGSRFGTHDWIMTESMRLAGDPEWIDRDVALAASAEPDTVIKDWEFHHYGRWGTRYGRADERVDELYRETVRAYREGRFGAASRNLGLLSHYYSDVCQPFHTDVVRRETHELHTGYEREAQTYTNRPGLNREWLQPRGFTRVDDARERMIAAAASSRADYKELLEAYRERGFDDTVRDITARSLNRAVLDLSDIIQTIPLDARSVETHPITMQSGDGGNVAPDIGEVAHGESLTLFVTPYEGFRVADVTVNGKSLGSVERHTIESVDGPVVAAATFVPERVIDRIKRTIADPVAAALRP